MFIHCCGKSRMGIECDCQSLSITVEKIDIKCPICWETFKGYFGQKYCPKDAVLYDN